MDSTQNLGSDGGGPGTGKIQTFFFCAPKKSKGPPYEVPDLPLKFLRENRWLKKMDWFQKKIWNFVSFVDGFHAKFGVGW